MYYRFMTIKAINKRIIKRLLDLVLSIVLLLILAIPMCIIAFLIKLESEGPVLFKQKRIGKGGAPFLLFKFRSMSIGNKETASFHKKENITTVGRFIRKWRIDEIPQLLNVLKGEMSIVGPRPTLPYQVSRYDSRQRKRLDMKPGITGWAQIHGYKAISWPQKIEYDIWYIENWSIMLDLRILIRTPFALIKIKNINVEEGPPPDEISRA
ncbi:MAG: sugar transferase [Candidatus Jordarchaeaceae archaeon]